MPHLRRPRFNFPKLPVWPRQTFRNRRLQAGLILVTVIISGILIMNLTSKSADSHLTPTASTAAATVQAFTPVFPKDKPELANNPDKTAYDGTRGVFSYTDSLLGSSLTVSQQIMPASMGSPEEAIAKVAATVGAKEPLTTSSGPAYMTTDSKTGSQVIVTSSKGLLVLIQSPFRHSNEDWKGYIESLQ